MPSSENAPITSVGGYRLFGRIGTGGMASVHIGVRPAGEEPSVVAIKRLHPHLLADHAVVTSFYDEARIAARIRHPNVVVLLDAVLSHQEEGEQLSLVMEYVEGESLARLLSLARDVDRPPSLGVASAIVAGALGGLHAAHEATGEDGAELRVVHRDVSPENILLAEDGIPKLTDFGVAKAIGRLQTTREGGLKGKCSYMAPEQIRGVGVTRKTDIFAMGAVLFELVTGRRLFDGDDEATILSKALFDPMPRAADFNPNIPVALDAVLENALDRDPTGRFHGADEMAEALAEAVPPASAAEVGAWVRSVAASAIALRRRAREQAVADYARSALASTEETARVRLERRRTPLIVGLIAACALVAVGFAFAIHRPSPATTLSPAAAATRVEVESPPLAPALPVVAVVPPPSPSSAPPDASATQAPKGGERTRDGRSKRPAAAPSAGKGLYSRD